MIYLIVGTKISVESFLGSSLKLMRLERRQMGAYLCIASNDVPPAVSKRVSLSVQCKLWIINAFLKNDQTTNK